MRSTEKNSARTPDILAIVVCYPQCARGSVWEIPKNCHKGLSGKRTRNQVLVGVCEVEDFRQERRMYCRSKLYSARGHLIVTLEEQFHGVG